MDSQPVVLEVKNSRASEETPASMEQIFAGLGSGGGHGSFLDKLLGGKSESRFFSFEIISVNSRIHFFVTMPSHLVTFVESQLTAHYPKLLLAPVGDYAPHFLAPPHAIGQLELSNAYYLPLKTYKDVKDIDLMASVLGQLSKLPVGEAAAIQFRLTPAGSSWQRSAAAIVQRGIPDPTPLAPGRTKTHPQTRMIDVKTAQVGFKASVRFITVAASELRAQALLQSVAGVYGVYTLGEGNSLLLNEPKFWQKEKLEKAFVSRSGDLTPRYQVLGAAELASMWHPPGLALSMIKNIAWGEQLTGEAPDNLPIATDSGDEKKEINFFARTEFRNKSTIFGIKKVDRRKHLYIVGKTGTGKSTMIANMAINDMRNNEGVAIIDPHGDLCDVLLDYIPSNRINDVMYLDPADLEHPFHLNPLEIKNESYRELIASGIVSIFYKLYHYSWGPRLEYILRNTILTLLHVPESTLLQVPEILTNEKYREKVVAVLTDPVLKNFWNNEFNKMSPQMKSEAVSPILNKVGQFLSSQTIRNIIGHPVSTIDLEAAMNDGKIVLVNLSQGKLGEDNSALLGAMIITKMQLAAMNRVYLSEGERKDFYLYVDEFQNFATNSFIKILSEARKYRLNLTLANQYIGQIDEEVQMAIFGNAGSLVSFCVGSTDARLLSKEFGEKYEEGELVGLGNFQILMKLSIDNHTSPPFSGTTIPLPKASNHNRDKVISVSREQYTKKFEKPILMATPEPLAPTSPAVAAPLPPKPIEKPAVKFPFKPPEELEHKMAPKISTNPQASPSIPQGVSFMGQKNFPHESQISPHPGPTHQARAYRFPKKPASNTPK